MARGQGEPPEARQAPALRGQSAGVLMDCQGHEQGYMQGFCRGITKWSLPTLGPCSQAVCHSTSSSMSLCSGVSRGDGSNGQAETQIGQWKHGNAAAPHHGRGCPHSSECIWFCIMFDVRRMFRQLATNAFRVRLIMLSTPHQRPDSRAQS
jgi:hypothetical protein